MSQRDSTGPATVEKPVEPSDNRRSQDDDDGEEDNAARTLEMEDDVEFDESDATQEIPHPKKHFIVASDTCNLTRLRFIHLPHPRSGRMMAYALCYDDKEDEEILLELQKHKPKFCTWVIEETVEPEASLVFLLPMDVAFFAIRLATVGDQLDQFVDFDEMLRRCDGAFQRLPKRHQQRLLEAARQVCESKTAGDSTYFRRSEDKMNKWFSSKLELLMKCPEARTLTVGAPGSIDPSTQTSGMTEAETDALFKEKCCRLLLEYLPTALHETFCKTVGVDPACRNRIAGATRTITGTHWDTDRRRVREEEDLVVEKKKKDTRSANVKRLEKAGPPKGVPKLTAFFTKKTS